MNFIWLLFAHFIGDIAYQGDWQAQNKGRLWYVMLCHCFIWAGCICVALQFLGIYSFWKAIFLLVGHWGCDKWKTTKAPTPENWWYIYPDQIFHLLQCLIVYLF